MKPTSGPAVQPGMSAVYQVRAWLTGGSGDSVTVRISSVPSTLFPAFASCRSRAPASCHPLGTTGYQVTGLAAGQVVTLKARIGVPRATSTNAITLTATATSPQSAKAVLASGTVQVQPAPTPTPTGSPTPSSSPSPSPTGSATPTHGGTPTSGHTSSPPPSGGATTAPDPGVGAPLPPGPLPGGRYTPPAVPPLPNPQASAGAAFPVLPPGPAPVTLPPAHPTPTRNVADTLPIDMPVLGAQVIGLVLLAAAVTVAVGRLSLPRRRPTARDRDKAGPGSQDPG